MIPLLLMPTALLMPACRQPPRVAARCGLLPRCSATDADDPWALLGLESTASDADVKRAFRQRARRLHPDVCADPAAVEKFRLLVDAFKKLAKFK